MVRLRGLAVGALFLAASAGAQSIPSSVQAAEAEGASHPRASAPMYTPTAFTSAFTGAVERKCAVQATADTSNGPLRSGEIVLRARLVGRWGLKANRDQKMYWQPLHNPFEFRDTLLIRAVRIDDPADSMRVSIPNWAYSPRSKKESGFPSQLRFPAAGNWLVIATAGSDWGCFVLPVETQ